MADDLRNLAGRIKSLETKQAARQATQLDNSSLDIADADPIVLGTAVADAQEATTFTIPGLQEALDTQAQRLQETAEAVAIAMDAADAATEAGLAAGDEANQAADDALERAQEALDAAAAISGDIYTGRPPTADDAGRPGQGWYVWDSNYHITAYYVYQDETGWVQTVLDDGAFGNIDAGSIVTGYLGAERLAAGSLTAAVLAADTLTSREIGAEAVLARNIKAASITAAQIAAATITGGNIAANTITAGNIQAGTITANEIAAGTITATQINLDSLNGKTITGATIRSAASGQRAEFVSNQINFYSETNALAGNIRGLNYPWGGVNYPAVAVGGGTYGVLLGGGIPIWPTTAVSLRVNGDTSVTRLFLDPAVGSDGYICGIYGFKKKSATDATAVPMPLLYAKGTAGSAYPDMFIENIKSVTAEDYLLPDGTSISADTGWVNVVSVASGYSSVGGQVRIVRGVLYGRGTIEKQSGTMPNASVSLCSLPASFPAIPTTTNFNPVWTDSPSSVSRGWVSTNRSINVNAGTAGVANFALSSINGLRMD